MKTILGRADKKQPILGGGIRPFGKDRSWHETDQPSRSDDVRCSGQTGSGWQGVEPPLLTPSRHPLILRRAPFGPLISSL